jgi:hypothetical protein
VMDRVRHEPFPPVETERTLLPALRRDVRYRFILPALRSVVRLGVWRRQSRRSALRYLLVLVACIVSFPIVVRGDDDPWRGRPGTVRFSSW